jgi:uncharacterized protein (TIGR00661 family)
MKILYAIQGTGNGHLSRAKDIIPALQKKCTVDILVSGTQADIRLRYPVKYRLNGLSFVFGKHGGVDIWNTFYKADLQLLKNEIKELPVEEYDFVINDFEPVSAWACHYKKVPCIALSHQSGLLNKNIPKPKNKDFIGSAILKHYAPASYHFSFHFSNYDKNIYTPVIRREIREVENEDFGYYTVYLPSYDDSKLLKVLQNFKNVRWQVFSKHSIRTINEGNISIYPVSSDLFTRSIAKSTGVLCGAGFETPAEAIYLGKKLMVIPMKGQLEQHFNAIALKNLGVPVIKSLKTKNFIKIENWLSSDQRIQINYPDITDVVVNKVFELYINKFQKMRKTDIKRHENFAEIYSLTSS